MREWDEYENQLVQAGKRRGAAERTHVRMVWAVTSLVLLGLGVLEMWINWRVLVLVFGGGE